MKGAKKWKKRKVIGFDALREEWKRKAIRNGCGEFSHFLKLDINESPAKHILWDLDDCVVRAGHYKGFDYNGTITISNSASMLLQFDDTMESARYMII